MMPAAAIRRGHATDLPAVSHLLNDAGLPTADLASAYEFQSWVLEEKGLILGVVGLERFGSDALLRSLAVSPEYRKCGLVSDEVKQSAEFRSPCPVSAICMSKALQDG